MRVRVRNPPWRSGRFAFDAYKQPHERKGGIDWCLMLKSSGSTLTQRHRGHYPVSLGGVPRVLFFSARVVSALSLLTAIPKMAPTTAMHAIAAALTATAACCGAWINSFPGCATLLPPVATCPQSSLDLRYPSCCRSVRATPTTLTLGVSTLTPHRVRCQTHAGIQGWRSPLALCASTQAAQHNAGPRTSLALY